MDKKSLIDFSASLASPRGDSHVVEYDKGPTLSRPMGDDTTKVRVIATTDCFIAIGIHPEATSDGLSIFLPANHPEIFSIMPKGRVSVVKESVNGKLYLTEGA
jgi:hypothetical protein